MLRAHRAAFSLSPRRCSPPRSHVGASPGIPSLLTRPIDPGARPVRASPGRGKWLTMTSPEKVAPEARATARPLPLWRNRDYLLLWSGQAVSSVGGEASQLALPLLILALTRSPAQAGLAGA